MLHVQSLEKKFGTYLAINDVSFSAQGGEIFGLLGPNGAGKTTTIRVIATVLKPTTGTATVAGFDILKNSREVRQHIGVLTADIGLYDRFTARENLRYFGKLYGMMGERLESRIDELLRILDMAHFADRKAGKFSTGMKQKVAIARSIIHDPKVVIFDEPTAGLDVLASQTVISYMQQARAAGKLVVLSTHDMAHAQELCDRVAIMYKGAIVANDTTAGIYKQTQTTSLEQAFISIVGKEEAEGAIHEREKQDLEKQRKNKFV